MADLTRKDAVGSSGIFKHKNETSGHLYAHVFIFLFMAFVLTSLAGVQYIPEMRPIGTKQKPDDMSLLEVFCLLNGFSTINTTIFKKLVEIRRSNNLGSYLNISTALSDPPSNVYRYFVINLVINVFMLLFGLGFFITPIDYTQNYFTKRMIKIVTNIDYECTTEQTTNAVNRLRQNSSMYCALKWTMKLLKAIGRIAILLCCHAYLNYSCGLHLFKGSFIIYQAATNAKYKEEKGIFPADGYCIAELQTSLNTNSVPIHTVFVNSPIFFMVACFLQLLLCIIEVVEFYTRCKDFLSICPYKIQRRMDKLMRRMNLLSHKNHARSLNYSLKLVLLDIGGSAQADSKSFREVLLLLLQGQSGRLNSVELKIDPKIKMEKEELRFSFLSLGEVRVQEVETEFNEFGVQITDEITHEAMNFITSQLEAHKTEQIQQFALQMEQSNLVFKETLIAEFQKLYNRDDSS